MGLVGRNDKWILAHEYGFPLSREWTAGMMVFYFKYEEPFYFLNSTSASSIIQSSLLTKLINSAINNNIPAHSHKAQFNLLAGSCAEAKNAFVFSVASSAGRLRNTTKQRFTTSFALMTRGTTTMSNIDTVAPTIFISPFMDLMQTLVGNKSPFAPQLSDAERELTLSMGEYMRLGTNEPLATGAWILPRDAVQVEATMDDQATSHFRYCHMPDLAPDQSAGTMMKVLTRASWLQRSGWEISIDEKRFHGIRTEVTHVTVGGHTAFEVAMLEEEQAMYGKRVDTPYRTLFIESDHLLQGLSLAHEAGRRLRSEEATITPGVIPMANLRIPHLEVKADSGSIFVQVNAGVNAEGVHMDLRALTPRGLSQPGVGVIGYRGSDPPIISSPYTMVLMTRDLPAQVLFAAHFEQRHFHQIHGDGALSW